MALARTTCGPSVKSNLLCRAESALTSKIPARVSPPNHRRGPKARLRVLMAALARIAGELRHRNRGSRSFRTRNRRSSPRLASQCGPKRRPLARESDWPSCRLRHHRRAQTRAKRVKHVAASQSNHRIPLHRGQGRTRRLENAPSDFAEKRRAPPPTLIGEIEIGPKCPPRPLRNGLSSAENVMAETDRGPPRFPPLQRSHLRRSRARAEERKTAPSSASPT